MTNRIVLIGPNPTIGSNPKEPLYLGGSNRGIGKSLVRLSRLDPDSYVIAFERHYLLPLHQGRHRGGDRLPVHLARQAAKGLVQALRGRTVVLVGRKVAKAFGVDHIAPFVRVEMAEATMTWIPNPCGANRWWNDPANRNAGEAFLSNLGQQAFGIALREMAA